MKLMKLQKILLPEWINEETTFTESRDFLVKLLGKVIEHADNKSDRGFEPPSDEFMVQYAEGELEDRFELAVQFFSRQEKLDLFTMLNLNSVLHLNRDRPEHLHYISDD